jgi:pectinesterase
MLKLTLALDLILATAYLFPYVSAASRTRPPAGSVIVRTGTTTSGEFSTVSGAVNSLPNDNSPTTIFIYPGTYTEQVVITRPGPHTVHHLSMYSYL